MPIHTRISQCQTHLSTLLKRYLPHDKGHSPLIQAMHYACLNGGKRLRPLLVYLSAEIFNTSWAVCDPLACAIEFIHCYSLIHDDLPAMDNDDLRRGKPTCHKVFGEANAILAGDALLTLAFEIVSSPEHFAHKNMSVLFQIINILAKASGCHGMVHGQAMDMAAEGKALPLADLTEMHRAKTGALLAASVQCGALISEQATDSDLNDLKGFSAHIGLGFQIQDDILDALGTSNTMGKHPGQDAKKNKCTFVSLLGVDGARLQAKQCHEQAISALSRFGSRGENLRALTNYLFERTS